MTRFGLAISTLNRRSVFDRTLEQYRRYTPPDTPIVVVDDGSDVPVPPIPGVTLIRNPHPRGVARVKNQGIAALMDAGCDHIMLSDDDCHPTGYDWWRPYVESGEHHLSLQLRWHASCRRCRAIRPHNYNTIKGRATCDVCVPAQPVFEDDTIHAVQWGSGVFLYFTRECVARIGGFRTEFGRYGGEHLEIGYRACNAGLIRYPFQDVLEPQMFAADAHSRDVRSCIPERQRRALNTAGWETFERFKDSDDYVEYREPSFVDLMTVCIPRRDTPDRVDAHERCDRYWRDHGCTVVTADSDADRGFLCSQARNRAVEAATTDIVVVADADTVPDDIAQIEQAVLLVATGRADMVYPYTEYRHIDKKWALRPDYTRAPVQQRYPNSPGGIFVMTKQAWERFGRFDERFAAGVSASGACFGFDDNAFRLAAETLGTVTRVHGIAWSFNHATRNGKPDRDFGVTNPNRTRYSLYRAAAGKPARMAELIRQ